MVDLDPDNYENNPDIEKQWAVVAMTHAETYMNLIKNVDASRLRLTPLDDDIYQHFRDTFPDMNVETIDIEEFKSEKAKAAWREWIKRYEKSVQDYNFGTLLRLRADGDYTEENSFFGTN